MSPSWRLDQDRVRRWPPCRRRPRHPSPGSWRQMWPGAWPGVCSTVSAGARVRRALVARRLRDSAEPAARADARASRGAPRAAARARAPETRRRRRDRRDDGWRRVRSACGPGKPVLAPSRARRAVRRRREWPARRARARGCRARSCSYALPAAKSECAPGKLRRREQRCAGGAWAKSWWALVSTANSAALPKLPRPRRAATFAPCPGVKLRRRCATANAAAPAIGWLLLRALYTEAPPDLAVIDDPVAARLLPDGLGRLVRWTARLPFGTRVAHRALGALSLGLSFDVPLRSAAIDDVVRRAVAAGVRQLVLLGAGPRCACVAYARARERHGVRARSSRDARLQAASASGSSRRFRCAFATSRSTSKPSASTRCWSRPDSIAVAPELLDLGRRVDVPEPPGDRHDSRRDRAAELSGEHAGDDVHPARLRLARAQGSSWPARAIARRTGAR